MPEDTDQPLDLDADRGIMGFMRGRTGRDFRRAGPFLVMFTPGTTSRWLNYAIPDDGAEPSGADVDAMVAVFTNAGRTPRLEFLPSVAPAVEARLLVRGFAVEERLPLMTCTPATVRTLAVPPGITLDVPTTESTGLLMASLQHEIFQDPQPVDHGSVARLRTTMERGGHALVAIDETTGALIGAAQTVVPVGSTTEIVGVAVAPSHRRRGLAAAMVSELARRCFEDGLSAVFLEAAPGADGAYRNAGFQRTSTVLHISLEGERNA